MKKNKLFFRTAAFVLSAQILSVPFFCQATTVSSESSGNVIESSIARSDEIGWIYETRNGKLYKCLFNFTTGEEIGDWILVG